MSVVMSSATRTRAQRARARATARPSRVPTETLTLLRAKTYLDALRLDRNPVESGRRGRLRARETSGSVSEAGKEEPAG